jgi:hypothetical protein
MRGSWLLTAACRSAALSPSSSQLAEADERYARARAVALDALAGASGGGAPVWRRETLHDR